MHCLTVIRGDTTFPDALPAAVEDQNNDMQFEPLNDDTANIGRDRRKDA